MNGPAHLAARAVISRLHERVPALSITTPQNPFLASSGRHAGGQRPFDADRKGPLHTARALRVGAYTSSATCLKILHLRQARSNPLAKPGRTHSMCFSLDSSPPVQRPTEGECGAGQTATRAPAPSRLAPIFFPCSAATW